MQHEVHGQTSANGLSAGDVNPTVATGPDTGLMEDVEREKQSTVEARFPRNHVTQFRSQLNTEEAFVLKPSNAHDGVMASRCRQYCSMYIRARNPVSDMLLAPFGLDTARLLFREGDTIKSATRLAIRET